MLDERNATKKRKKKTEKTKIREENCTRVGLIVLYKWVDAESLHEGVPRKWRKYVNLNAHDFSLLLPLPLLPTIRLHIAVVIVVDICVKSNCRIPPFRPSHFMHYSRPQFATRGSSKRLWSVAAANAINMIENIEVIAPKRLNLHITKNTHATAYASVCDNSLGAEISKQTSFFEWKKKAQRNRKINILLLSRWRWSICCGPGCRISLYCYLLFRRNEE